VLHMHVKDIYQYETRVNGTIVRWYATWTFTSAGQDDFFEDNYSENDASERDDTPSASSFNASATSRMEEE
jgi:hypothetical protein